MRRTPNHEFEEYRSLHRHRIFPVLPLRGKSVRRRGGIQADSRRGAAARSPCRRTRSRPQGEHSRLDDHDDGAAVQRGGSRNRPLRRDHHGRIAGLSGPPDQLCDLHHRRHPARRSHPGGGDGKSRISAFPRRRTVSGRGQGVLLAPLPRPEPSKSFLFQK